MAHEQFEEWREFWRLEPWGEERADWRMGHIVNAVASPWLKQGANLPGPAEYVYKCHEPTVPQTAEQMQQVAKKLTAAFGGKIVAKPKPAN